MTSFTPLFRFAATLVLAVSIAGCVVNAGTPTPLAPAASLPPGGDPESPLDRDWMITWIDGYDADPSQLIPLPGLIMTSSGTRLVGNTSCNQLSGGYMIDANNGSLRFTSLRNERNFCQAANAAADDAILRALIATDGFDRDGPRLRFMSKGRDVLRLFAKP